MDDYKEGSVFEANTRDWRISNLKSAYRGILSEEAIDYELSRLEGLQELKRKKIAAAKEKFEYEANIQYSLRILIAWLIYCQIFFRVWNVVVFVVTWVVWKDPSFMPSLAWPFERWDGWWMRRFLIAPVLGALPVSAFFFLKMLWKKLWTNYRQLSIMILGGWAVVFLSLIIS